MKMPYFKLQLQISNDKLQPTQIATILNKTIMNKNPALLQLDCNLASSQNFLLQLHPRPSTLLQVPNKMLLN